MTTPATLAPRLMTARQACQYLSVSRSQLYALWYAGRIRSVSLGRKCRRFTTESIDKLIDQQTENTGT